jgi:hypothetical protein
MSGPGWVVQEFIGNKILSVVSTAHFGDLIGA